MLLVMWIAFLQLIGFLTLLALVGWGFTNLLDWILYEREDQDD